MKIFITCRHFDLVMVFQICKSFFWCCQVELVSTLITICSWGSLFFLFNSARVEHSIRKSLFLWLKSLWMSSHLYIPSPRPSPWTIKLPRILAQIYREYFCCMLYGFVWGFEQYVEYYKSIHIWWGKWMIALLYFKLFLFFKNFKN